MKRWDDETLGEAWIDGGDGGSGPCPRGAQAWDVVAREGNPDSGAFLDHAASCAECASALRLAREIHVGAAAHAPERAPGLWAALTRTVLHPIPALAYLLVLAIAVPLVLRGRPEGSVARPEPVRMLAEVRLTGDVVHRGEGSVAAARLPRPSGPTALRLYADLEAARDLAGAKVRIRLLREGREVLTRMESADTVGPDGSVLVVLEEGLLGRGTVVLELAAFDPAGAALGPAFRQTLQID